MVEEYGRPYCDTRPAMSLVLSDFEAIAWAQVTCGGRGGEQARIAFSICDTELHTTATWSDLVVGARPACLTEAARARHYDLVLLLDDNVPWIEDGTRVLRDRRVEHTRRLREELDSAGRHYVILSGGFEEREREAERLVASLLSE